MPQGPSPDILVYVALSEEFDDVLAELPTTLESFELNSLNLTGYRGEISTPANSFRIVIVPAGKMGPTVSAAVTATIVAEFRPQTMVVLGISGSMSDDLQLGDVFVPASVKEFMANAAARGEDKDWRLQLSGEEIASDGRLVNRFQNLKNTNKHVFDAWQDNARKLSDQLVPAEVRQKLKGQGIHFDAQARLKAADDLKLASGPIVGKGAPFAQWLKEESDRKFAAMDMESAGVYQACKLQALPPQVVAVRGISDYADERKAKIQQFGSTAFRKLATRNATAALLSGIRAGFFGKKKPEQANNPAENFYAPLVKWIDEAFHLKNWNRYSDLMIRGMVPYFFEEAVDQLNGLVFRANWPASSPNLKEVVINLSDHASRFLKFYLGHARPSEQELYRRDHFYDSLPYESQKKHKGAVLFGLWSSTCIALLCNVVLALNRFSEEVRKSLDSQFHSSEKFVLQDDQGVWAPSNGHSTEYVPEDYYDPTALLKNYRKEEVAFEEYREDQS